MPVIHLPETVTHKTLIAALAAEGALNEEWGRVDIDFPSRCFVEQGAVAFLCEWAVRHTAVGRKVGFYGDESTLRYLARMDVFKHAGFDYHEKFQRHPEAGRFIPARLIEDDRDVLAASNAICDLVLRQFDNARAFLPAMEWAVYEIVDNIRLHSSAPVPGVVTAQYYPQRHRLDIAIVDMGRGIKASLGESKRLSTHQEAISLAIQRGVTRDPEVGQGNGMAGTCEIVRKNRGELYIWSGDADFCIRGGRDRGFVELPNTWGTGVFMRLDTRRSVALGETFIGDAEWSYIDSEAQRLADAGGIRVSEECVHTGGREPAKALRRKLQAILHETEETLTLDFDGVAFASSSFLDELLGRMMKEVGSDTFVRRVRVVNLNPSLVSIANVAIGQRLGGEPR